MSLTWGMFWGFFYSFLFSLVNPNYHWSASLIPVEDWITAAAIYFGREMRDQKSNL